MLGTLKVSKDWINNCLNMFYPIIIRENLFNRMNDLEIYNYCSKETGVRPLNSDMAFFILKTIKELRNIYSDNERKATFELVLRSLKNVSEIK